MSSEWGLRGVVTALAAALLTACAGSLEDSLNEVLPEKQPKYKSSTSRAPLELPPELSSATLQDAMLLPSESAGDATFSQYASVNAPASASARSSVLPEIADVRVARAGDQRWLVVNASPDAVWSRAREFWLENGFLIAREDPAIGIMETGWAENRSDIPQGFIRRFLENITTKLYSAATRDKFRVRLERGFEAGTTEVYVSHRGAEEVAQGDGFVWQPRPSDPGLEAEILHRMMVFFGLGGEQAERMLARAPDSPERARLVRDGERGAALALDEDFSRAWRRTGLALDRVGFTVEDRDRSRGLYYVRYVDPLADAGEEEGGWLSKLKFWGAEEPARGDDAYLISLVENGANTEVVVLNGAGERERSATADRILGLLHEQLR